MPGNGDRHHSSSIDPLRGGKKNPLAIPAVPAVPEGALESVMDNLNWGYIQLGLVALVFGGLQMWWISSVFWRRELAKPMSEDAFRNSLERIWSKGKRQ